MNPAGRKQWDIDFHTAYSPFLKEIERQSQTAGNKFKEICQDKNTLMSNPTVNGAIDLVEKSKIHVKRSTIERNLAYQRLATISTAQQGKQRQHRC